MPRKELARAIDRKAYAAAREHGERREYGTVHSVDPLQIEMRGSGLMLDEEDLVISQWVRRYDYDIGLDVGDGVVVDHLPNDDFLVADVVAALDAYPVYNYYSSVGLTGGSVMFGARVQGDTNDRFRIRADGTLEWGNGSSPMDTSLYRAGANTLKTGKLIVTAPPAGGFFAAGFAAGPSVQPLIGPAPSDLFATQVQGEAQPRFSVGSNGALQFGTGTDVVDTFLYRYDYATLRLDGAFWLNSTEAGSGYWSEHNSSGTANAYGSGVAGEARSRWKMDVSGRMDWGNGSALHDVSLYRSSAGALTTTGWIVANLGFVSVDGGIWSQRSSAGQVAFASYLPGDTWDRWHVFADGTLMWGSGTAALDQSLKRVAAASGFPTHLEIGGTLAAPSGSNAFVGFGNPAGLAGAPSTFGGLWYDTVGNNLRLEALTGGTAWRDVKVAPLARLLTTQIVFGTGDANYDTSLYRISANTLYTPQAMQAGGRFYSGAVGTGGIWVDGGTNQFFGSMDSARLGLYNGGWNLLLNSNGKVEIGADASVNLYRSAAGVMQSDAMLILAGAQASGKAFGLQVGTAGQLPMHYQGSIAGGVHGFIGHNVWFGNDGLYHWDGSHPSFGSRGIFFNFTTGIEFYADAAATTAGATFTPTQRMRIGNDGVITIQNALTVQGGVDPTILVGYSGNRVFQIRNTGKHEWGPGGTDTVDVSLYRSAADVLKTDDTFHIGSGQSLALNNGSAGAQIEFAWSGSSRQYRHTITSMHDGSNTANNYLDFNIWTLADAAGTLASVRALRVSGDGKLWLGNAVDTNLYRSSGAVLGSDGAIRVNTDLQANAGTVNQVWVGHTGGALAPRITFGNALDTALYRSGASQLKTDASMIIAGGLALGAQTPGAAGSLKFGDGTVMTTATPATVPDSALPPRLAPGTQVGGISVTDWNNARQTGFYDGNGAANAPVAGTWFLGEVVAHRGTGGASDYITQRVWTMIDGSESTQRTQYVRQCINSVWGGWRKVYTPRFQDGFNTQFGSTTIAVAYGGGDYTVALPFGWTNHFVFLAWCWPGITWSGFALRGCLPSTPGAGVLHFDNGDNSLNPGGQNVSVYWMSIGN